MYRINRVNSARRLWAQFTSTSNTAISTPSKQYHGSHRLSHRPSNRVLPSELSKILVKLTCDSTKGGVCRVYLIGTSYYSAKSRQDVETVINILKPQAVFLDLCSNRSFFTDPYHIQSGASEYLMAYKAAKKYGGEVILGDRLWKISFDRLIYKIIAMPMWQMAKLFFQMCFHSGLLLIPKRFSKKPYDLWYMSKNKPYFAQGYDVLCKAALLSDAIPVVWDVFVTERDQYMSAKLLEVARKHHSVVAVVGERHLPGIQKYWKQPIEVEQLNKVQMFNE